MHKGNILQLIKILTAVTAIHIFSVVKDTEQIVQAIGKIVQATEQIIQAIGKIVQPTERIIQASSGFCQHIIPLSEKW